MLAVLFFAALAASLLYLLNLYQLTYWKRRGIPQLHPTFLFGDLGQFLRLRMSLGEAYGALYKSSRKLPFVGAYFSYRPVLLVNDPELIKHVLVRDFEHFHDRGFHVNEVQDPLSGHLVSLGGDKWKHVRGKLTPTFTSGRLKEMFPNIVKIGRVLEKHIEQRVGGEPLLIREIMTRYTIDVIASVGFGIENDSINEDDNAFRRETSKIFASDLKTALRLASTLFFPKLKDALGFKCIPQNVEDFMIGLVRDTLEYRESSGVVRKDMMQLLLQLRNSGTVSVDERWDVDVSSTNKNLSLEQVTAHALVFFVAGYETSSTTISFCLYELAKNVVIRRKVQQEIDEVLSRSSNGEVTYENIAEMKYLEQCIDETLRKYPPLPFLNRECTKEYAVPGSAEGVVIEKGTPVVIPLMGLYRDPDYFPEPDRFIPERFGDHGEEVANKLYLSFGGGPRICIGMRLGKLKTKLGIVMMLSKFEIQLADELLMVDELKLNARNIILLPETQISLVVTKRK